MTRKLRAYRQGDVLFYQVEPYTPTSKAISETIKAKKNTPANEEGDHVLALGEVTGHRHRVSGSESKLVKIGNRRFLDVPKKATVVHEEHNPIPLPKGKYEVVIEREYEIGGKTRVVAD